MLIYQVRLRKPSRVLAFLGDEDLRLERDEQCIVESDRGLEYGTCILPPEPCPEEEQSRYAMKIVRKANLDDESTYHQIVIEEEKARRVCADKIAARDLPMKLVDAEYTFDRKKVVFYFTAEERVDFRELVRDLAHDLKTRIELRHIQVRDQAKMVGGIGSCGRELCCTTWLREFMPISMKMAKRQNLSLNPSKISGQCGRLMCCLSYENDLYEKRKKVKQEAPAPAEEEAPVEVPEAVSAPVEDDPVDAVQRNLERKLERGPARERSSRPPRAPRPQTTEARETNADNAEPPDGDQPPKRRRRRRRRKRQPSDAAAGESAGNNGNESS